MPFLDATTPVVLLAALLLWRLLRSNRTIQLFALSIVSFIFYVQVETTAWIFLPLIAGLSIVFTTARNPFPVWFGILTVLLPIAVYKAWTAAGGWFGGTWDSPSIPIGLNFFSLQAVALIADGRDRRTHLTPQPVETAAFLSFFPQLLAGPIVRPHELLPQFRRPNPAPWITLLGPGVLRIGWGLFKKLAIADTLAGHVSMPFAHPESTGFFGAWGGAIGFAAWLYLDFSAYADLAVGLARLFGIRLPENFRQPFFATSMSALWSRYHMTLSHWLRDYVYIPLGGNRAPKLRHGSNLLLTFLISGAWHGAGPTMMIWALFHGLWVAAEHLLRRGRFFSVSRDTAWLRFTTVPRAFFVGLGFAFAIVMFRADSLGDGLHLWHQMLSRPAGDIRPLWPGMALAVFVILEHALVLVVERRQWPGTTQLATGLILIWLTIIFGTSQVTPLHYLQF